MKSTRVHGVLAGLIGLAISGCGLDDGLNLARVRGKVVFQGEPVKAGFIVFSPDESKKTAGPQAMSKIADDGSYVLSTKVSDDGATVGFHKVGIIGIDPKPIVEVDEDELTPQKLMATKAQMGKRQPGPKKDQGPTFTDRGGNVYRVLTPEKLRSPETSGVSVEVRGGSNTIDFQIKDDGTVEVGS
jgi:hypothetical protein